MGISIIQKPYGDYETSYAAVTTTRENVEGRKQD